MRQIDSLTVAPMHEGYAGMPTAPPPQTTAADRVRRSDRAATKAQRGYAAPSAAFDRSARLRSLGSSSALRRRIDFGVTSTSSSSWM